MASLFPSISMFPRYENIFITPHCHQVSHQTRSFKSTPLSLPAGWIFISYQSKSLISTHSSKPDILVLCLCSRFDGKSAVHVWPSFLWVYHSAGRAFNQFQLKLFTLFWKMSRTWLSSTVSSICGHVHIGQQGWTVKILLFLGQTKFQLKIPRLHLGTDLFFPSFPLSEHIQQIIQSVQDPPILLFTLLLT